MKSIGYSPTFAGAVEAVASTGGQLMPPIMGAAAFVMAQFLGISYAKVALAAAIPALLYYAALFVAVDLKAKEDNLLSVSKEALRNLGTDWKKRLHLMIPVLVLIYMIFKGFSLQYAALLSTICSIALAMARPETRLKLKGLFEALEIPAKQSVVVTVPSAVAGIIVGVVTFSGLGMKFSTFLLQLTAGRLYPTLVMVMIGCLICGMAMPTTAAYIISSVLMAPALISIGVAPIAAHMFIIYFAILSMVTPPVALAAYAGAGIAGADAMRTGYLAWFLALSGFIVPYAFVMNTALLLQGSLVETVRTGCIALAGSYFLARGLISKRIAWWMRGGFILAGILLIDPGWISDAVGMGLAGLCLLLSHVAEKKRRARSLIESVQ
jgi:TRAP transporter 4TM/12TM fusion protein